MPRQHVPLLIRGGVRRERDAGKAHLVKYDQTGRTIDAGSSIGEKRFPVQLCAQLADDAVEPPFVKLDLLGRPPVIEAAVSVNVKPDLRFRDLNPMGSPVSPELTFAIDNLAVLFL